MVMIEENIFNSDSLELILLMVVVVSFNCYFSIYMIWENVKFCRLLPYNPVKTSICLDVCTVSLIAIFHFSNPKICAVFDSPELRSLMMLW